jgi:hypothetical protein
MTKKSFSILVPALFSIAHIAHAQVSIDLPPDFAGFSNQPLPAILANLVATVVGFLGYFLIVIIFYAGLLWMTSGGNDEKIAKAKGIIGASIIGMILILMSYSIAGFIVRSLTQAV